jgi:predicted DNA-binding antitoxin AbrB/MazE fold protein
MTITIEAVYANGTFQPMRPVELAEGTPVQLTIHTADETEDAFEAAIGTCDGPPDGAANYDDYDPLDEVIGICKEGPEISLAAHHDDLLYGQRPPMAEGP